MSCDHLRFDAQVDVHRLEDTQAGESLRCMVEMHVWCAECRKPLQFALPLGVNLLSGATMSEDATEARLTSRIGIPREPQGAKGFSVLDHRGDPVL